MTTFLFSPACLARARRWSASCALVLSAACDFADGLALTDAAQAAGPPAVDAAPAGSPAPDAGGLGSPPPADGDASSASPDATPRDAAPASDGAASDAGEEREDGAAGDATSGAFPFPPLEATGAPLTAPDRVWTYIEFPDTRCRDGSPAGVSISLNKASKKLLIYLEGAVYCLDELTCLVNADKVDHLLFNSVREAPTVGIFDQKNPRNPVRDWNIVYVPNCTGDGHGGANPDPTDVPNGPRGQYFVGHLNVQKYLQRIVPTFPDVTDVLLAGISSGGFGVFQNLVLVQRAFPKLKVRYVNDSAPAISKTVIPECLQERMRKLWRLDLGALSYCAGSCPNQRDYLEDNAVFLAKLFADRPGGFIDALTDEPMMMFYGIGLNECTGTFVLDSVPADTFRAALIAHRERLEPFANYGTYMPEGTEHIWLTLDTFYTASTGGVTLVDWFKKVADGVAPGHAGPAQ